MMGGGYSCSAAGSAPPPEGLSDGCRGAPLTPGAKLPLAGDESLMKAKAHGTTERGVQPSLRWNCDVKLADRICWCVGAACCCVRPLLRVVAALEGAAWPRVVVGCSLQPPAAATTATTRRCALRARAGAAARRAVALRCSDVALTTLPRCQHAGYWTSTSFLSSVDRTAETTFYDSVTGRPLFVAPRGRSFAEWEAESRSHGWPSFRDEEVVWDDVRVLPDGEAVSTAGTHLGHNLPDRKGVSPASAAGCQAPRSSRTQAHSQHAPTSRRQPLLHQPGERGCAGQRVETQGQTCRVRDVRPPHGQP